MSLSLLASDDLAELLKLSRKQVHRLRVDGQIPPGFKVGGVWRWKESDIQEWIDAGSYDRRTVETKKRSKATAKV